MKVCDSGHQIIKAYEAATTFMALKATTLEKKEREKNHMKEGDLTNEWQCFMSKHDLSAVICIDTNAPVRERERVCSIQTYTQLNGDGERNVLKSGRRRRRNENVTTTIANDLWSGTKVTTGKTPVIL